MQLNFSMASPYDKILTTDKTTVIMYSPRISGKSYALGQVVYIYANKYPKHDIVVTRAKVIMGYGVQESEKVNILLELEKLQSKQFQEK